MFRLLENAFFESGFEFGPVKGIDLLRKQGLICSQFLHAEIIRINDIHNRTFYIRKLKLAIFNQLQWGKEIPPMPRTWCG